jgi:FlaA1/EpsC-like NDP-sugar epimerase
MTLGLFIAVLLAMGGSHFIGLHDATLQSWFAAFFCTGIVALISERLVLRAVLRKWGKEGRLDRRTIIVGADKNGEQLITALRAQEGSNVDILGVFDDRGDGRAQEICAGISKLGKVDDILEFAYRTRVDLILFALPISAEKRILQMLRKLWFFRSISTFRPTQVNFASVLAIIQILHRRQHYQCLKSQSPIGTW